MALRSAHCVPGETMQRRLIKRYMWKLATERRRRRSHCARNAHGLAGQVFQMGGKFPPERPTCTLQDVTGQTVTFLQGFHRGGEGVG